MKKITILLTGCIHPNTAEGLVINNADVRKRQYLDAIHWYLTNTPYHIVFCENSGTDVADEIIDPEHRVEFLTYVSKPMKVDYGKGLREMEIIEYAEVHSKILMESDIIVKGTGRLVLKNIMSVVSWIEKKNLNNFCSSWMSIKMVHSDSRFFFCSPSFLKVFVSYKSRLDFKINFEKLLAICIGENRSNFKFVYPYIWYNIEGVGGGMGEVYHFTNTQYWRLNIKNVIYYIVFNYFGYWPH